VSFLVVFGMLNAGLVTVYPIKPIISLVCSMDNLFCLLRNLLYNGIMAYSREIIIKTAKSCLRNKKNELSAHIALGIVSFEANKLQEAQTHYERALTINKKSAEAHAGLGMVHSRLSNNAQVIEHLSLAYKYAPDCGLLANWLADAYYDSGMLDEAISLYSEALKHDATDGNAQNDMADAYRLKKDYKTAILMYDRALAIDPHDTNAMLEKAQCLIQLNELAEALSCLNHLIKEYETSRDSASARVVAGALLEKLGRHSEAYELLKSSLVFFPYNKMVLFNCALCGYRLGKMDEAEELVGRILQMNPDDGRAKLLLQRLRK
jgi:tetratricopeptide (TPR) repeat protein